MKQKAILIGGDNWKNLLEAYISNNGKENLEVLLSIPLSKANEEYCRKLSPLITYKNFYTTKPNIQNMSKYTNADVVINLSEDIVENNNDNDNNDNNLYKTTLLEGSTIHFLGIPSLPVKDELRFSPYVGIAESMAEILSELNLKTIFYGTEGSEIKCSQFESIISEDEFNEYARDKEPLLLSIQSFFHTENKELWSTFFDRLKPKLLDNFNKSNQDIVLVPHALYGHYLEEFRQNLNPSVAFVEYAVGYHGKWTEYSIFPSHYQQAAVRTMKAYKDTGEEGYCPTRDYDFVIPHTFDHKKYEILEKPSRDYLLYLGRVQHSKGWDILEELTKHNKVDIPIRIAGPVARGHISKELSKGVLEGKYIYEGIVGMEKKIELLSNAKALLAPSKVYEIFNMAAVEGMLCGTPVICSEAGGLAENIIHNKTGYICKILSDYSDAIKNIDKLDRNFIADYARMNFSNETNKYRYEEVLRRIHDVHLGNGWYSSSGWNLGAVTKVVKLKRDKALVIVAHQDDELIDHGIFLKKSKDTDITVVVVTKPGSITPNPKELSMDQLEKVRKLETLSFCTSLDIEDIRFLDLEDGNIDKDSLVIKVKELLDELKPDIVLTHPLNDSHQDHAIISKVINDNNKDNFYIRSRQEEGTLYNDDINWKLNMLYKYFKSQVPVLIMDRVVDSMSREDTYI